MKTTPAVAPGVCRFLKRGPGTLQFQPRNAAGAQSDAITNSYRELFCREIVRGNYALILPPGTSSGERELYRVPIFVVRLLNVSAGDSRALSRALADHSLGVRKYERVPV